MKRTLRGVELAESVVCAAGLGGCTLLAFAQVVNRYWLHFEVIWLGNLALYFFIFFMFIAAAQTTWRKGHITVSYFHEKVFRGKLRTTAIHRIFIDIISIVILCVFLPAVYNFASRALQYPEYSSMLRWFNLSWLQITLLVGLVLVLVHLLVITARDIDELIKSPHL